MSKAVLDSSAALAVLQSERGSDIVLQYLPGALVSTVNVAEIVAQGI